MLNKHLIALPIFFKLILQCILAVFLLMSFTGCNRAEVRIPGASAEFPKTLSGYQAKKHYADKLTVTVPIDLRTNYHGVKVGGTNWEGCETDTFFGDQARYIIRDNVMKELSDAKLFQEVSDSIEPKAHDLYLRMEINAFCSQVKGFVIARVAGIVSMKFSLMRDDQILYSRKIEKVVTDADPEYTGSQVGFIEQAMRRTMSDSLRTVFKILMSDMEQALETKLKSM